MEIFKKDSRIFLVANLLMGHVVQTCVLMHTYLRFRVCQCVYVRLLRVRLHTDRRVFTFLADKVRKSKSSVTVVCQRLGLHKLCQGGLRLF